MAVNHTPDTEHHSADGKKGSFFKKNKVAVIAGGGIGALLLLSHKGSTTGGASGTDAALQAYQQGVQDAAGAAAGSAGNGSTDGTTSGDGGGGVDPSTGASNGTGMASNGTGMTTDSPSNPVTINVSSPAAAAALPAPTSVSQRPAIVATVAAARASTAASQKTSSKTTSKSTGAVFTPIGADGAGKPAPITNAKPKSTVHPSEPTKKKPAPANSSGKHPTTNKTTSKGHSKNSPVQVEAMEGAGNGITVMGRSFPGANGHRLGPPRVGPMGYVERDVTVFFGGHTEVHTCCNNGDSWMDNTRGRNPLLSRTVPGVYTGV